MRKTENRPIVILLIEDNRGDVELVSEGLKQGDFPVKLLIASDGDEGLAILKHEGAHVSTPRPDIVLLDINLPKKNGHEVLKAIRVDCDLTTLPVIMLTTSDSDKDVVKSYQYHANAYITKPENAKDFLAAVRLIEGFWFSLAKLPSN